MAALPDHYDQPEGSASARTICKSAKLKRGRSSQSA